MRHPSVILAVGLLFGLTGVAKAQPLTIVNNQLGAFVDISVTGTALNLNDDDEAVIVTAIGNAVFPAGSVVVANNGGLAFPSVAGQNDLAPLNAAIPSATAFNGRQSALAYWDDLKGEDYNTSCTLPLRGGKNGNVFWKVTGTTLIVQWNERPVVATIADSDTLANSVCELVTFQIQIFGGVVPGPGAIYAQFIYQDIQQPIPNGGASATIGYQNGASDSNDVQWSFNTAGAVSNGMVLSLVDANSIPAVSDVGNVALVLLFLMAGIFVFRRGRAVTPIR